MSDWISVEDRLPQSGLKCMLRVINDNGFKMTVCGEWRHRYASVAYDCDLEHKWLDYNEHEDLYYLPEGFFETTWAHEDCDYYIGDKVTHWQPLPPPPEN